MGVHRFKKGLDLPITGDPEQVIHAGAAVTSVALMAADYVGMKPTMFVKVGDKVKRGQPLFEDKKSPGTKFTSPAAGTITAVNRGDKRALQSVVIELSKGELKNDPPKSEIVSFKSFKEKDIVSWSRDEVRALLIESGLWTSFRTRPFSKVPHIESDPDSIFITAIDTNPLAADVDVIYEANQAAFEKGLAAIAKLREGHIYLCTAENSAVEVGPYAGISHEKFDGPHPAGTAGLHIHTLRPAHSARVAWTINYQDVIALGTLISTGKSDVSRVISIAGPQVSQPRLVRTRIGASTDALLQGGLKDGENRIISGSVLSGRSAQGDVHGYLGRHHLQISVIAEDTERVFLGWLGPGQEKFSLINTFVSKLMPKHKFNFTTTTNGSARAMVPIGMYEQVMPMDLMATHLLRALIVGDVERAERLGCLELDEEDLALCTFACPGKYEYGPYLRDVLTTIESEG
ncbi:MAG TPA: Na(+)-translocating NADH-quinone reductase subunit A [Candidatus Hydrogenedentes bacterium]|nr:Na(+)-translocating NADH-quinone reductase subunit A [Candidatus Hydrogenedentota bacterium]